MIPLESEAAPVASQGDRLAPGTLLAGTYRLGGVLGSGGTSDVYEARHLRLAGRYAVKVLRAPRQGGPRVLARFRQEAEVTSSLCHPNVVHVLDYDVMPDGRPYLVMELLDGIVLADVLERWGKLPIDWVVSAVGQIASALAAAHALGIVHRDLKPQNLFLARVPGEDRSVVKVLDFGISKVRGPASLTEEWMLVGTPQYMAPEQALGRVGQIDGRTDQFSLAAIVYEMLAGRPPFSGPSALTVLYQVVHETAAPLEVGGAVQEVVSRALAKWPEDRFPSIREFHAALARAAATSRRC